VVVVGVDARWIARSLESRYRELLHVDGAEGRAETNEMFGAVRSDDYLEKIFQIPLWLRPMDRRGVQNMIQGILGQLQAKSVRTVPVAAVLPKVPTPQTAPAPVASATVVSSVPPPVASPTAPPVAPAPVTQTAPPPASPPAPNAESLEIRGFEIEMMDDLSPLLGRSPRSLKRFVNVYRLIKAGLGEAELGAFLRVDPKTMSSFQAVQFLLAVDTGLPRISRDLLDMLQRKTQFPGDDIGNLITYFAPTLKQEPEGLRLRAWLLERQQAAPQQSVIPELMAWAPRVARYSFQAAPLD
jgi:hypothetical protein